MLRHHNPFLVIAALALSPMMGPAPLPPVPRTPDVPVPEDMERARIDRATEKRQRKAAARAQAVAATRTAQSVRARGL